MIIQVHGHDVYCDVATSDVAALPSAAIQPTMVFIHGAQQNHAVWRLYSDALAQSGCSTLAVDLPGHGQSRGPALENIEAQALWLLAVLDALALQHVALIGHSMGALTVLEAAWRDPRRVRKIALLGVAFPMRVAQTLLETARQDEEKAAQMIDAWSHIASGFESAGAGRATNSPGVLHTDLSACNNYCNGLAAAAALRCPVLFVLAKQDKMTPLKAAIALTDMVAQGKILFLENCGHAMLEEQPEAVRQALYLFARDEL